MLLQTRPEILTGKTHRIKTGYGWLYVTINELDNTPVELFATIGKSGASIMAKAEVIGRFVSLCLRYQIPIKEIIDQLIDVSGSEPIAMGDTVIKSIPDAIGKLLHHLYIKTPPTKSVESL
jgi:ribonucleoside-diphosphate reductase alpha chain